VICSQGRLAMLADTLRVRTELTRDSVSYLCMPLFHGNSMMMNFAPAINVGATIGMARKFSASGFVRDIHRYQATYVNYVGRALSYVLAVPEGPQDRESSLRLAGGTEASMADIEQFSRRFNCRVSEGYGMSEGVLRIGRTADTPPDSIGLPVGGAHVQVLNEETGAECPPARMDEHGRLLNTDEAIGQIVATGKAPDFEGYYKNPEAYAQRVHGEDFWTGDLAYRDASGFFYFAGRSSDWLRVDSENFAAAPIERIVQRWEPVAAALVYPVPDPRTGDQVMCAVEMKAGAEFDPDAFASFLDAQPDLGTKWRPRFVRVVDEVPTTGNNKVTKTVLRRIGWVTSDPV
jgi:fatty-acyl-CoA synthase